MIKELANVLGTSESALHAAIHQAALDAGRAPDAITVSWGRNFFKYSLDDISVESAPYPNCVLLVYGPTKKLAPLCELVRKELIAA